MNSASGDDADVDGDGGGVVDKQRYHVDYLIGGFNIIIIMWHADDNNRYIPKSP